MSKTRMKVLVSKRKLPNLKSVDIGLCKDYIFSKQKVVNFSKISKPLKVEKLDLVHLDMWGSSPISSIEGPYYYVTFIDDSTRKVWVYFLKKKSKVCDVFKKWKAKVENKMGLKVKHLKFNNRRGYGDENLKEFCVANGIKLEKTVPRTP